MVEMSVVPERTELSLKFTDHTMLIFHSCPVNVQLNTNTSQESAVLSFVPLCHPLLNETLSLRVVCLCILTPVLTEMGKNFFRLQTTAVIGMLPILPLPLSFRVNDPDYLLNRSNVAIF